MAEGLFVDIFPDWMKPDYNHSKYRDHRSQTVGISRLLIFAMKYEYDIHNFLLETAGITSAMRFCNFLPSTW